MILYINACPREESRTHRLARALLQKLGGDYQEVPLEQLGLQPLSRERLEKRTALIQQGSYDDPMFALARQFASADEIVVAAPFWDLSFPAILKLYLENIYVTGLVSTYGPTGQPIGLCRAKKLYYVTTAGGPYNGKYSYEYLREMATVCFGIPETELLAAELLDLVDADPEAILQDAARRYGLTL